MKTNRRVYKNDSRLEKEKTAFFEYLMTLGYVEASLQYPKQVMKCLEQFMYDHNETEYTLKVCADFLEDENRKLKDKPRILRRFNCVVRHYNEFILGQAYTFKAPIADRTCPKQYQSLLSEYLKALDKKCLRERTILRHRDNLIKILQRFDTAGTGLLQGLKPSDIYAAFEQATDKHGFSGTFRCFLRYLHEIGHLDSDMSDYVPFKRKTHTVPSVYTGPEIDKFLSSFDLERNTGKRNYAMVLLALRLGIRSNDITNLKIKDVDFHAKTINFTQGKTGVPQRLELLPDVEEAICAYLKDVRQESRFNYLFLTTKAPIRKLSIQFMRNMIRDHLVAAGIKTGERRQGPHALRMTLASELVAEKVPYDVVRKVLGHENPSSTKNYVSFDIEGLRSCAITVPPIMGKLSEYIYAQKAVPCEA